MQSAPWTDIGALQQSVQSLESSVRGKADSYAVSSLDSRMDRMESANRELSSEIDGLRRELQQLKENFRNALDVLAQITTVL